jgi:hypothetical protein
MPGNDQDQSVTLEYPIENQPTRALCIHGHFYQPPRDNPFTGIIPDEVGAAPYPNWNIRIHTECYRPNAELGNFERISFNVGPTLFEWMEDYDPVTYQRIIAQDRSNLKRFGVGNAMAQAYNHTILPWATRADKDTQICWGIADFEHRFGRRPQGMWLPEAAVDYDTLEVLVDYGIEFTILAPWQTDHPHLDPSEPYWVRLPSGRRIAVFFYQKELSGGVSFDQRMTSNAHEFALKDLVRYFNKPKYDRGEHQMLVVASDGELYGHHQAFRDWFLAYLVNGAGSRAGIQLTFPALWMQSHPPKKWVGIREKTSWSCHHGVTRWANTCGCVPGDGKWKASLRRAFDNLAVEIDQIYQEFLTPLGIDPWTLRNAYIEVVLGEITLEETIVRAGQREPHMGCDGHQSAVCNPPLSLDPELADALPEIGLLLEAQRHRQRMYTSCGWFFDDFDRIEPQNNVAYAAQAVNLIYQATGKDLSSGMMRDLKAVVSRRSGISGDQVFDRFWRGEFQSFEPIPPFS